MSRGTVYNMIVSGTLPVEAPRHARYHPPADADESQGAGTVRGVTLTVRERLAIDTPLPARGSPPQTILCLLCPSPIHWTPLARPGGSFSIMCSVSQWERAAIGERTREALRHKKTRGQRIGKCPVWVPARRRQIDVEAPACTNRPLPHGFSSSAATAATAFGRSPRG